MRASNGLEVSPVAGEPTRFLVESASAREPHLVDLAPHSLVGECSCEHFQFRFRRMARKGLQMPENMRCKHIEAAREVALDLSVAAHERARGGQREEQS